MNETSISTSTHGKLVKHKAIIPTTDLDLIATAERVGTAYTASGYTIAWIPPSGLSTLTSDFKASFALKEGKKHLRRPLTSKLESLNAELDDRAADIKVYLEYKYSKANSLQYYAQFGFIKKYGGFTWPKGREGRLNSIRLIIQALPLHNLSNETYGLAYFQDLYTRYENTLLAADNNDSQTGDAVNSSRALRPKLRKALNAIIHIIRANHPDDWEAIARVWGFQKVKY